MAQCVLFEKRESLNYKGDPHMIDVSSRIEKEKIVASLGKNYINGVWRDGSATTKFESWNPTHTDDVIGAYPLSNSTDVDEAVDAAKTAFPAWRGLGMVKRAQYIKELLWHMERNFHSLAWMVTRESGKHINEAEADVREAIHMAEYAFSAGTMGRRGEVIDLEVAEKDAFTKLVPRGVAVAITPWNFPIAIPLWQIALTLVYGNTVILKPSEETPACGELIAKLADLAKFPPGVFNLVQGYGAGAGWRLVCHPDVNVIILTGHETTGAKVKLEVARHPNKICTVETGGKSAVIILEDALNTYAIPSAILSAFKTTGQRCVSASRIIIARKKFASFAEQFLVRARRIKVGHPFEPEVFCGPMINKKAVVKGMRFNEQASQRFNVMLDRNNEPLPTENGYWLWPFVYMAEWNTPDSVLQEEPFSPHTALIPADNPEHAAHIYNDTRYGLAAAVITENYRDMRWMEEHLDCGLFYWNAPCIGADVRLPFGGVKQSGNLIPSAAGLIPVITHQKAVTYNRGIDVTMAQGLSAKV